jgi:hypothetical protein
MVCMSGVHVWLTHSEQLRITTMREARPVPTNWNAPRQTGRDSAANLI